jgi:hypothetical protein
MAKIAEFRTSARILPWRRSPNLRECLREPHGPPEWPVSAILLRGRSDRAGSRLRRSGDKTAKFWLSPVRLSYNFGFAPKELNRIERLVREHEAELVKAWNEYFKPGR